MLPYQAAAPSAGVGGRLPQGGDDGKIERLTWTGQGDTISMGATSM